MISMARPHITEAEIAAVNEVLRTPVLSIGPWVERFERRFAEFAGTRHAVAVSSGTAGLHCAVIAAGVGEGDLVVTTPFSFISSANAILYERGVPVFVDIDEETGNIDPALAARAIQECADGCADAWVPPALRGRPHGALRAILPVHVFGQPADLDPIVVAARAHGIAVIEDACEAVGSGYRGRRVGGDGDAAVFAFYPNKQITTGEGGMIVTDRDDWAALFRSLRNQGRDTHSGWLTYDRLGYNYRLDEMSAALGSVQIGRIEELVDARARVATAYTERLASIPGVTVPSVAPSTTRMSWFVYVVRFAPEIDRDRVIELLASRSVPSRPYFTPIHLQSFYRERFGFAEGDFPVTEALGRSSLALPFHHDLSGAEIDEVCSAVAAATQEAS